jgi:hypothetical protein
MSPPSHQLLNTWTIFMKLGMCIMTTEPISTTYLINPSHQSVCLSMYPSYGCKATARLDTSTSLLSVVGNSSVNMFPRKRIQTIEELLDASFSMRSVISKESLWVHVSSYPLLGTNSVKVFPRKRRISGGVVFYAFRVVSKESTRLFRPRTSCLTTISVCQTTSGRFSGWWVNNELIRSWVRTARATTQLCGKHISAVVYQYQTIEEAVLSVGPPRGCVTRISRS